MLVAVLPLALGAQSAATPSRNFIWKVTGATGAFYLVGSVHLLTEDYYPLSPALDAAFADSDLLVEEADLGELEAPASQFKMLTRGMLPSGQSLDTVLSPATYALVSKRIAALGIPIEPLKRFKPWMLALTLVQLEWQKAGFDGSLGLDRHFYDRAKALGRPVQGLETVDYQLSLFDGMTLEDQDRMLAESIEDFDAERKNMVALIDAWKAGDARTVERLLLSELKDDPVMFERLLTARNRNWVPKIDALVAQGRRAFVVVGAAHLVGPDGLLEMFKAKGYKVEQL
jgi:uncharacterized protein YbaP (TraB family)